MKEYNHNKLSQIHCKNKEYKFIKIDCILIVYRKIICEKYKLTKLKQFKIVVNYNC